MAEYMEYINSRAIIRLIVIKHYGLFKARYRRVIKSFLFQLKMLKMKCMVMCLLGVFYEYYALVYR